MSILLLAGPDTCEAIFANKAQEALDAQNVLALRSALVLMNLVYGGSNVR